jgi:nucleotide-binding universal stress UspA family protein
MVGVSGSPTSHAALLWALKRAARTVSSVVLLTVIDRDAAPDAVRAADDLLQRAVDDASEFAPVVIVSFRVLRGDVAAELTSESSEAGMLVVGGHNGSDDQPDGDPISWEIAARAVCPTVVVPESDRLFAHGVVLGLDESGPGREAVAFAGSEAASARQRLTLVRAWSTDGAPDQGLELAESEGTARRTADRLLAKVGRGVGNRHPDVLMDIRSVHGPVGDVLAEASVHARLLVLGVARSGGGAHAVGLVGIAALRLKRAPIAFVHEARAEVLNEDAGWEDAVSEGWVDRKPELLALIR